MSNPITIKMRSQLIYIRELEKRNETKALILFALRELQCNIQYAPDEMLTALRDYYQIKIATPEELYANLEAIAQSLNSGDENV